MTENRRIALNTVATYSRTMFGVLCGIFSTRWVLEALGQVDFGLYGLVGSLVVFVAFLNIQFSSAVSRYYAFSIGAARRTGNDSTALQECRSWFSMAILTHTVLSGGLIAIGYPIGHMSITHLWLNIPIDRMDVCVSLWQFACISCFVNMISVPFYAMYYAKQYIAELTIYSFVQTFLRTAFIFYMVCHPRDWLWGYGLVMLLIAIVPAFIISFRAYIIFPECRLRIQALKELWRIKMLGLYAFWQGMGGVGYLASHQGMNVLVNNAFGPSIMGSFSVSQTVSAEASALTGALQGAFAPALTSAYGAGDMKRMKSLLLKTCKFGTLFTLLFAIPMAFEIEELLFVWLKSPPPMTSGMCIATLAFIVIEKLSSGHVIAVNASGEVARFQLCRGLLRMIVIPIALLSVIMGLGPVVTSIALPVSALIVVCGDVLLARSKINVSVSLWLQKVVIPIFIVALISCGLCGSIRFLFGQSLLRMVISTVSSTIGIILSAYFLCLTAEEQRFVGEKFANIWSRLN